MRLCPIRMADPPRNAKHVASTSYPLTVMGFTVGCGVSVKGMRMKPRWASLVAALLLFVAVGTGKAGPVDESYSVSGSAGNWLYDFSVTNNLGGSTEIYYYGVALPNAVVGSIVYPSGWFAGNPGGWNWSGYGGSNTNYNTLWITCPSPSCPAGYPLSEIYTGQTLSGFQISDSGLTALTSVSWFAVDVGYYAPPQPGCSFICFAPYTNPGFEGLATPAAATSETPLPAALPLFGTGLGITAFLARRRKRKNTAAIAA